MIADLAAQVPDALAAYRHGVVADSGGPAAVPLRALHDPGVFDRTLSAFAAGLCRDAGGTAHAPRAVMGDADGGPSDRRILVSYWSQYYLAALATPALTALIRLGRPLPLAFETARLELDAAGRPLRFLVPADAAGCAACPAPGLTGLVEAHLRPFVDLCHARCGIAPRVLWGNAAVILDYVARELGIPLGGGEGAGTACDDVAACLGWRAGPACARALSAEADSGSASGSASEQGLRSGSDCNAIGHGSKSPLAQAFCPRASGCRRRRVCCLRHRLPGVPSCGALCPVEGTAQRRSEPRC